MTWTWSDLFRLLLGYLILLLGLLGEDRMSPTPPGGEGCILEPGQARSTPSRPAGRGYGSSARSGFSWVDFPT